MSLEELREITNLKDESEDQGLRGLRRVFYTSLLSMVPSEPSEDLKQLCEIWRIATRADWTWLWLYHPEDSAGKHGHWELTSVSSEGPITEFLLENFTPSDPNSTVAALANEIYQPIYIPDVTDWKKTFKGRDYRVVCSDDLKRMKCESLLCIPLVHPKSDEEKPSLLVDKYKKPLRAAICAHFRNRAIVSSQGRISLRLMGQLTAKTISSIFEAEQQRIIATMNSLASEYLTRKSKNRPAEDRKKYLDNVIDLIRDRLRVKYVSVYYRNSSRKLIHCVATNSLYDQDGKNLSEDESKFRLATYKKREGLTGRVYATGIPYFHQIGESTDRAIYKYRETPVDVEEATLPWIIYPIYSSPKPDGSDDERGVLGVIRCVGNEVAFVNGRARNIDPVQIQTLDFIVRMLAPVLETMASNIERERIISIIKHDLFAPLEMARDLVKIGSASYESNRSLREHFFANLLFCLHSARMLVSGLDESPNEVKNFNPRPTKMEADIVAGIKNMLTPFAKQENNMRIQTGLFANVFPEWILVDRDLITRAICNLVINAIKYGVPGETIFILARADDSGFHLRVENRGNLIPEADRERIFEEGFRSERALEKFGLGMGLPIARAIMERHSGTLRLIPSSERTIFSMFFPKSLECSEEDWA